MFTKNRIFTALIPMTRVLLACAALSLAACAGDLGDEPAEGPAVGEDVGADREVVHLPSADPALEAELVATRDSHCDNSEIAADEQAAHEAALAVGTLRRQSRFARLAAESAHEVEPEDVAAGESTAAALAAIPAPSAEILARQQEYLDAVAAGESGDPADLKGEILDGE